MNFRLPGADRVPIQRREGGYCAEGPGFYVWDEDPAEVERVARDLGRGRQPEAPSQRMPDGSPSEDASRRR